MSISWYRSPVDKDQLKKLSERNEVRAHLQAIGHISMLLVTGSICYWLIDLRLWLALPCALFLHGTVFAFLGYAGASHELSHATVFKNAFFNRFYLQLFTLLTWNNPVLFARSHKLHHLYTLDEKKDGEVNPTATIAPSAWFFAFIFNFPAFYRHVRAHVMNSMGDIRGGWVTQLFPLSDSLGRAEMTRWSRWVLSFHLTTSIIFLALGQWQWIIIVNLGSFFGGFFPMLLAHAQHCQKAQNSSDYRANCRTIILHPLLEFFYWGMNFHLEHHMYPNVPFYHLSKLHRLIAADCQPAVMGVTALMRDVYVKKPPTLRIFSNDQG